MHYTPRQAAAWLHFGEIDRRRVMAEQMALDFNAARADPKDVSKQIEELRR